MSSAPEVRHQASAAARRPSRTSSRAAASPQVRAGTGVQAGRSRALPAKAPAATPGTNAALARSPALRLRRPAQIAASTTGAPSGQSPDAAPARRASGRAGRTVYGWCGVIRAMRSGGQRRSASEAVSVLAAGTISSPKATS
ncbi:hypothetical protein [Streptomyces sp. ST1015]|uniref:hypothetical protein n=1 Tax=Streptomyces sp. ST1015 TaxID=1848900 RepID=UPI001CA66B1C|nr:hypothetical protein [Streptomyces sp. ST1015]QZZ31317.1 hypothetical protein A7X85_38340 [Streptomyces sp. ST1015]